MSEMSGGLRGVLPDGLSDCSPGVFLRHDIPVRRAGAGQRSAGIARDVPDLDVEEGILLMVAGARPWRKDAGGVFLHVVPLVIPRWPALRSTPQCLHPVNPAPERAFVVCASLTVSATGTSDTTARPRREAPQNRCGRAGTPDLCGRVRVGVVGAVRRRVHARDAHTPGGCFAVGTGAPVTAAGALPDGGHADEREARERWIAMRLAETPSPSPLTVAIIVSTLAPTQPETGDPDSGLPRAA